MDGTLAGAVAEAIPQQAPAQEAQAQAIPEAQADAAIETPDGEAPAVTQEAEQWIELPTGERFRTVDELVAAKVEASRYINNLHQQLRSVPQQPAIPAAQADPVAELAAELEQDLRLEFPDAAPQAIKEQARINAKAALKAEERAYKRIQGEQRKQHYDSFITQHPYVKSPFGLQVAQKYDVDDPDLHLRYMKLEAFEQGIPWEQITGQQQAGLSPNVRQTLAAGMQARPMPGLRTPAGQAAAQAPVGDNPTVLQVFEDFKNARPRATQAELDAALKNIRERVAARSNRSL